MLILLLYNPYKLRKGIVRLALIIWERGYEPNHV
jgi:hypothetical protein